MSEDYTEWLKKESISGLTGTQVKFAKFLLNNRKQLEVIGDIESIFKSVRKFVKDNPRTDGK